MQSRTGGTEQAGKIATSKSSKSTTWIRTQVMEVQMSSTITASVPTTQPLQHKIIRQTNVFIHIA